MKKAWLFLLVCVFDTTHGQHPFYKAMVIDCNTRERVAYADIYNESRRMGVIADSTGIFYIRAENGDTLIIQTIGYQGKVFFLQQKNKYYIDTILICPQSYDLGIVELDLPSDYNDFKKRFLEIETENKFKIRGLPESKTIDIPVLMDTNILNSTAFAIASPISYLYYKYSKEEQSKRKVFYLERQKREQVIIDRKYNRELIERVTGLKGDSITEFLYYCNFSHQFLYEATELEIVQAIDKKFKQYLAEK